MSDLPDSDDSEQEEMPIELYEIMREQQYDRAMRWALFAEEMESLDGDENSYM